MAMTLRLSEEDSGRLRAAAERAGVSMQEFAQAAIKAAIEDWARERDEFLADFARDNKSLLDRLGQ
ncbi:MAG: hypothetical protein ABIO67_01475 [Mycobacteriales bacterium]